MYCSTTVEKNLCPFSGRTQGQKETFVHQVSAGYRGDARLVFLSAPQGSLSLKLPVGKAVVQSLSFHPTETCLLTAMEGRVQVWGAEPEPDAVAT